MRVAAFNAQVVVLSRRDYILQEDDPLSRWSPVDFAVAWGEAARLDVRKSFRIQQPWRRYSWRYKIASQRGDPEPEIVRDFRDSTANWHIMPASKAVDLDLRDVDEGDALHLEGYLVDVRLPEGRMIKTSRSRTDQGDGACEIFFVEKIRRLS